MERRRERKKKKTVRIATLYGMNSTARLPITTRKRRKKKNKKKDLERRRMEEAEEKDRHKYSYASRHDSSKFIKGAQSFEILTNVQGSPRDPIAARNAARDDAINNRTWKMGYQNAISTRPVSGKVIKVTQSGQIKLTNRLGKGWPFDTSLNRPDLVRGPEPWAPPLTNVYPKDWPSNKDEEHLNTMPENSHYPWSPPRRPSSANEALLGSPKNVFSTGRRSSLMSTMKPAEFYEQKRLRKSSTISGSGGFWNDENDPRYNERGNKQQSRRLIRSATVNGRFQHKTNKYSNSINKKRRPRTGPSSTSKRPLSGISRPVSGKSVQFDAESPARGRIRPQTAKSSALKRGRGKSKGSGNRPQTALTPVQNRKDYKSRPKSAMPAVRPQTAILKNRSKPSNLKINTGSSKIRKEFTRSSNSFSNSRPHTVGPSPSRQRNPSTMKRSKSAGVFREHDGPEPHHRRPTTATKTKRKYRVGLWPSGKWKYDYGEHITHHGKSRKGMSRKLKKNKERIENGEEGDYESSSDESSYDGSDAESVDENGETAKQRYKRRNNVTKRPMVAGQKKKKKLFESSSLATYTVMRSAPLKKHTLEEMLHAQEKETFKRVGIRNDACAWLLNHGRFKRMPMMRLWKKFSPIALQNIAVAGRRSNASGGGGGGPKSPKRKSAYGTAPNSPVGLNKKSSFNQDNDENNNNNANNGLGDNNSMTMSGSIANLSEKGSKAGSILQTVDNEPWRTEDLEHNNMWVSRPQFIYNMRVLMGLNETQKNLRELNKLYSSFDTKVQDMMNIREFCFVFVELREEKKRAVFGGMPDVSRFYEEAKSIFANQDMY